MPDIKVQVVDDYKPELQDQFFMYKISQDPKEIEQGLPPLPPIWYLNIPGVGLACLKNHQVDEHDDGTVSAHPSILVSAGNKSQAHGYLTQGFWRSC